MKLICNVAIQKKNGWQSYSRQPAIQKCSRTATPYGMAATEPVSYQCSSLQPHLCLGAVRPAMRALNT